MGSDDDLIAADYAASRAGTLLSVAHDFLVMAAHLYGEAGAEDDQIAYTDLADSIALLTDAVEVT